MENEVQYFEKKFGSLIDKAYQEVQEIEPSLFLSRVTYLPVLDRPQHRTFIEERLTKFTSAVTIMNIWLTLNLYWDFLYLL